MDRSSSSEGLPSEIGQLAVSKTLRQQQRHSNSNSIFKLDT